MRSGLTLSTLRFPHAALCRESTEAARCQLGPADSARGRPFDLNHANRWTGTATTATPSSMHESGGADCPDDRASPRPASGRCAWRPGLCAPSRPADRVDRVHDARSNPRPLPGRCLLRRFDYNASMEEPIVVRALAALAQPLRLRIFRILVVAGKTGLTPGAIAEALGVPAATLSFHLKELMHAELVTQERDSRYLIYRAAFDTMTDVIDYLMANCCQGAARLKRGLVETRMPAPRPARSLRSAIGSVSPELERRPEARSRA
jgi:ArsR family transcriptional regulator